MADARLELLFTAKDEASGVLSKFSKTLGDVGKIAAGFVIGKAITSLPGVISSATGAASDLEESMSKVNVVFGDSAGGIVDWSKDSARAFGQSKQAALEAVGTYGNLFQAFGVGREESADMSKSLVELAADMASFNNTPVDEALVALRSGLSGEAEPLKRFGVAINDARLKDEALRLGLIKTTKEALTPGAKAQAAYALIMKDTTLAQGDFARTSDGLANKQRIIAAEFANLQARIGSALIPILVTLGSVLLDKVIPAIEKVGGIIIGALGPAIEAAIGFITRIRDLFALGLAGGTIGGEFSVIEQAAFKLGTVFRDHVIPFVQAVADGFHYFKLALAGGEVGGEIGAVQQAMFNFGVTVREMWTNDVQPALASLQNIIVTTVQFIQQHWGTIGPIIGLAIDQAVARINGFIQVIQSIVQIISGVIQLVDALMHGEWSAAWDAAKKIMDGIIDGMLGSLRAQFGLIPDIILGAMVDVAHAAGQLAEKIYRKIEEWINKVPGLVRNAIAEAASALAAGIPGVGTAAGIAGAIGVPGFDSGGVVPGPIGAARLAVVHGGETILPTHRTGGGSGGGGTNVTINAQNINIADARSGMGAVGDLGFSLAEALRSRGVA